MRAPRRPYELRCSNARTQKQFVALPEVTRAWFESFLNTLCNNPHARSPQVEKLEDDGIRIRHGDFRVVLFINERDRQLIVASVGNRRDVYRRARKLLRGSKRKK